MADRIPLIVNPDAKQIQEIASGDNLTIGNSVQITGNLNVTGITTTQSGTGGVAGTYALGSVLAHRSFMSSYDTNGLQQMH
tara:strand:- start:578 stop:820 length:243 start_codon:yes stop_codon:yes gene_type:complete